MNKQDLKNKLNSGFDQLSEDIRLQPINLDTLPDLSQGEAERLGLKGKSRKSPLSMPYRPAVAFLSLVLILVGLTAFIYHRQTDSRIEIMAEVPVVIRLHNSRIVKISSRNKEAESILRDLDTTAPVDEVVDTILRRMEDRHILNKEDKNVVIKVTGKDKNQIRERVSRKLSGPSSASSGSSKEPISNDGGKASLNKKQDSEADSKKDTDVKPKKSDKNRTTESAPEGESAASTASASREEVKNTTEEIKETAKEETANKDSSEAEAASAEEITEDKSSGKEVTDEKQSTGKKNSSKKKATTKKKSSKKKASTKKKSSKKKATTKKKSSKKKAGTKKKSSKKKTSTKKKSSKKKAGTKKKSSKKKTTSKKNSSSKKSSSKKTSSSVSVSSGTGQAASDSSSSTDTGTASTD